MISKVMICNVHLEEDKLMESSWSDEQNAASITCNSFYISVSLDKLKPNM